MERAIKPLRPKNIQSKFCIQDFIKANKKVWVIINLKTNPICLYGSSMKNIKNKFYGYYRNKKILTVKKLK